jgi:hypothetical protein
VALQRGPLVYCFEAADNGGHVRNLVLRSDSPLATEQRADLLGGVTVLRGRGLALHRAEWPDTLYLPSSTVPGTKAVDLVAIPYYANANRQQGEMMVWLAEDPAKAQALPLPTIANQAVPGASHCNSSDTLDALSDGLAPENSADESIPRFTWWDHRGTREWVQYEFDQPTRISAVEVYWWDERKAGRHCRVPREWRLLAKSAGEWKPVAGASGFGIEPDRFNRVTFTPIVAAGLRLEAHLQAEWSGGILEWRVE